MTKGRPKYPITGWINSPVRRQKSSAGGQSKRTESQSPGQKQLRVGTQGRGTRYKERWMPTRRCRKSAVIGRSAPSGGKKPLRTRARILGLGPRTFNGE